MFEGGDVLAVAALRDLVAGADQPASSVSRLTHRVSISGWIAPDPGFQPPTSPHERMLNGPGGLVRESEYLLLRQGPCFRQDFPDGLPVRISDGRTVWSFYHWPGDTFRVDDDVELTAVRRDLTDARHARPPVPTTGTFAETAPAGLLDGTDPISPVARCVHHGRDGWRFDLPDRPEALPTGYLTYTTFIVDAATGLVIHTEGPITLTPDHPEKHGSPAQTDWHHTELTTPVHPSRFVWTGPQRPLSWFAQ